MSITRRITLTLLAFSTVLVLVVGALAYLFGSRALFVSATTNLMNVATEKQGELDRFLKDGEDDVAVLAASSGLLEAVQALVGAPAGSRASALAGERVLAELATRLSIDWSFQAFFLMHPKTGEVIVSTDPDEIGKLREYRPYFLIGKSRPIVEGPYYSLHLQGPALTAAAPVRARDHRLLGVLAGRLNIDEIQTIMLRESGLQRTDESYLVNAANLFVTHPRFITGPPLLRRSIHTEGVRRCLSGESDVSRYADYRGIPVLGAHRWIAERKLCLFVEIDQAEIVAPSRTLLALISGIGVAALLLATVISGAVSRQTTRPLERLRDAAIAYREGDLDSRALVASRDEVGQVALAFNQMAETIGEQMIELRDHGRRLAESNAELDAFAYSVAHDLRAPLRAVDGFSAILLRDHEGALPDEAKRYLAMIRGSAQQQRHLIDSLLELSRTARHRLEVRTVRPAEVAQEAFDSLAAEREGRTVRLEVADLPACQADRQLLARVYANLLSNALKFTRTRAEAVIEVGWREDPAGGARIYYVRDNGVGFDMRYAEKLFAAFERLHRADEYEGTGVGLATAQRIVHRHGGRIWAESEVGEGATFCFTLGESPATTEQDWEGAS